MRQRLIGIYLLLLVVVLGVISWKIDRDYFADKISANEVQSRSQLAALTRAAEAELEGLVQVLDLAYPILLENRAGASAGLYSADQAFSRFHLITRVVGTGADLHLEHTSTLEKSAVRSWGPTYILAKLKGVSLPAADGSLLLTILDPERRPWFLYIVSSPLTQEMYAALLPVDFMQNLLDHQKGQLAKFALVNEQAEVVAHSEPEYIGNLMPTSDPVLQQIQNGKGAIGAGLWQSPGSEQVHGFFEKVGTSNLYVTIQTPVGALMADRNLMRKRLLWLGLSLAAFGICVILIFPEGHQEDPAALQKLVQAATPVGLVSPQAAKIATTPEAPRAKPKRVLVEESQEPPEAPPLIQVAESALPERTDLISPKVEEFSNLFSEEKVDSAMAAMESLEPLEKTYPIAEPVILPEDSVQIQAAPPHPDPAPATGQTLIQKPSLRPSKKADHFSVAIRRPKSSPAGRES